MIVCGWGKSLAIEGFGSLGSVVSPRTYGFEDKGLGSIWDI